MIALHGFGAKVGLPDASPFVLKLDAYLRMAGLPYERVAGIGNLRKSPKGKLPFIIDDGQLISDSAFVIKHLQAKYGCELDAGLDSSSQAIAYLLRSTLEEKMYWCTLYFRWVDDEGWAQIKPQFFAELPLPLKWLIPAIIRRGTKNAVYKQGTGRHSRDEVLAIAREGFASISTLIGDGPFLFGENPCSTDATLYAFLAQTTLAEIDTPVNRMAREFPTLLSYSEHFRSIYYKDEPEPA